MSSNNNPTFIFIDGSYFCFYRYHSLLTWWRNAFPEQLDVLQNPYANATFVDKFKKIFLDTLVKLPKNLGIDKSISPTIIVGRDCKRCDIWRNDLFPKYKGTRDNRPDNGFMGGPFFKMVYDDQLFIQGGATTILHHNKLEADDCIAISVKELLKTHPNCNIYIVTSDKDYLQLAEPRVQIFNLAFKNIADQKSSFKDATKDLFCKIVIGDVSDNIPSVFPKCGIKTAVKYYENRELFEKKLLESDIFQKQYELNKTLIDFNCIPQLLVDEFLTSIKTT